MLVISSLRRGGTERVASLMANHWAETGHEVFLVTMEGEGTNAYSLRSEVVRVVLDLARESRISQRGRGCGRRL